MPRTEDDICRDLYTQINATLKDIDHALCMAVLGTIAAERVRRFPPRQQTDIILQLLRQVLRESGVAKT